MPRRRILPLALLASLIAGRLLAQERPSILLRPVPDGVERPQIDGELDDEAWDGATELGPLRQVVPVAGGVPTERTRVRITFDARSIFVALECFDSEPGRIRDTQRQRDARLNPDDRVELFFDTFDDQRNAYWFQIGAGGSEGDALITKNGGRFNKEWDGLWEGRARITPAGWQAEIEIPLATMNFDPRSTRWGFNLRRFIRRRNEEVRWARPTPRISFFTIAQAGALDGLEGLEQGLGLTVRPFFVADLQRDRAADRQVETGDLGVDVFYNLTPSFKLSASVNTDFAETEVDERRVNLTRFPLFFPEQRDFFLEDSGNFFFGSTQANGRLTPFFSRRIGIDSSGGEVPLEAAVKLTGQTERFTVGLLDVQTESDGELEAQNLFVGRVSANLGEQSDVGLVWTHGDPGGGGRADTYGMDLNYRTNDFLGDRNLELSSSVLRADRADAGRDDMAYALGARYPNDVVQLSGAVQVVEEEFRPALGFVPRRGIQQYDLSASYNPRLYSSIRQLRLLVAPRLVNDTGGRLQSARLSVQPFGLELETGDEASFRVERVTEVLEEDFEIQDGVVIPVDRFDETRFVVDLETASFRPVELAAGTSFGGFFGGHRTDWEVGGTFRPGGWGNFGLEYQRNHVRLPAGDFVVRIWRARVNFQFSPRLSWTNFVQYDNVSDFVGLNSRIRWIVRPGHNVFLVANQGWEYEVGRVAPSGTQLTAKMGYALRF